MQGRHRTIGGHYTVIPLADDGWDPIKDVKRGVGHGYSHRLHNAHGDVFVECLVWKGRYAGLDDMSRPRDSSGGEP